MNKVIEQVDVDTGEIMRGFVVYIPHRPKVKEPFFMGFQEKFELFATDPEMTGSSLKVLMYLFSKLDFENFIYYSQSDIAKAISMQRSNVSRAFRFLISKGIVLQSQKVGSIKCYRLNPNYGWKGKVSNLDKHNRDHLKLVSSEQVEKSSGNVA